MSKKTKDENNRDLEEYYIDEKPSYSDFIKDREDIEAEIKKEEEEKKERLKKKLKIEKFLNNENSDGDIFNKVKYLKRVAIVTGTSLCALIFLYFCISFIYFHNRFLPSTTINGVDCSSKSVEEVSALMSDKLADYHLAITNNDVTIDEIYGKDIGLEYGDMNITLDDICVHQQKTSWLKGLFINSEPIFTSKGFKYNTSTLNQFIDSSLVLGMIPTKTSVNAYIKYSGDEFTIIPAVFGNEINKQAFKDNVVLAVNSLKPQLNIDKDGCYILPTVTEDDATIIKSCKNANNLVKNKIILSVTDDVFEIPIDIKADWYVSDEYGNLILNTKAFNAYMDKVDSSYSANTEVREFKTMYGDSVNVTGGDFGSSLDRIKFKNDIEDAMFGDKDATVIANFITTAKDIGATYIEVDLSNQALAYFINGEQQLYSPIITGRNGKDYETPEGVYRLKSKSENVAIEENKQIKTVKYWMSFGKNIGICDAVWKDVFGSQSYKTDGSDGSVYAIEGTVKELFENVAEGTPVVLYHHAIVENFYTEDTYMAELYNLIANKPEIPTYNGDDSEESEKTTEIVDNSEEESNKTEEIIDEIDDNGEVQKTEIQNNSGENEPPKASADETDNVELPTTE